MIYEFEKDRVERALKDYIHLFNKKFLKEMHSYENETGNYVFIYKYYDVLDNLYIVTTYPDYVDIDCYWFESGNSVEIK